MDMDAGSNKDSRADESVSSPGTDDHAAAAAPMSSSSPAPAPATATARPYYECVFCKRGFTTAQALGGHMNIHRRDRAAKPAGPGAAAPPRDASTTTTVSRSVVECYSQYRHLAAAYPPPATSGAAGSSSGSSFAMYYGGSTGAGAEAAAVAGPRELSLFDAATDHGLHLGVGGESRTPEESEQLVAGELPERELDLELRLGRHTKQ